MMASNVYTLPLSSSSFIDFAILKCNHKTSCFFSSIFVCVCVGWFVLLSHKAGAGKTAIITHLVDFHLYTLISGELALCCCFSCNLMCDKSMLGSLSL